MSRWAHCHGNWVFLLCSLLIAFVADPSQPAWKGYVYAILMFIAAILQSLTLHQYFHKCFNVGMRSRTALISAVYKKVLYLILHPYPLWVSWERNYLTLKWHTILSHQSAKSVTRWVVFPPAHWKWRGWVTTWMAGWLTTNTVALNVESSPPVAGVTGWQSEMGIWRVNSFTPTSCWQ